MGHLRRCRREQPARDGRARLSHVVIASAPSGSDWFGASWETLAFVILSSLLIYLSALAVIRVGGRKTVAHMTAADFVVTVALGTIVGSTAVSRDPSFAAAIFGIIVLVALQQGVAFGRRNWPQVGRFVDFTPRVAVWNGEVVQEALAKTGMAESELMSKLRMHGVRHLDEVQAAIIESTGEVSVFLKSGDGNISERLLQDVTRDH